MMQTILANMLFNKDKFQLNGTTTWFKMTAEPTIYPTKRSMATLHTSRTHQNTPARQQCNSHSMGRIEMSADANNASRAKFYDVNTMHPFEILFTFTTPKENTMKTLATTTVNELHNILANTSPAAAKDETLPTIMSVQLTAKNGQLLATATDRYRIAQALATADYIDADMDIIVPVALVKQIIGTLKTLPKPYSAKSVVDISVNESQLTVHIHDGATITGTLHEGDFPRVSSLFPDKRLESHEAAGVYVINPAHMVDMMKVKHIDGSSRNQPTRMAGGTSENKPMIIEHGDWFRGLIMPMRVADGSALHGSTRFDA